MRFAFVLRLAGLAALTATAFAGTPFYPNTYFTDTFTVLTYTPR